MWTFKRKLPAKVLPPPQLPPGMTLQQFQQAQDSYVTKYDKLVKSDLQLSVEAFKAAADFGKLAVTYLLLGNTGGLAALVVLAPIMRDTNQLWLGQQLWTAICFAGGAILAVAIVAVVHFNFTSHGWTLWAQAKRNDVWIKGVDFGLSPQWKSAMNDHFAKVEETNSKRANLTNLLSVLFFLSSATCWGIGAILLAIHVVKEIGPM